METIKIYKVTVPNYYAYPSWNVILKLCYTKEDAENYIKEYPNLFIKAWMKIEEEIIDVRETD